ncbi:CvpA family protein [Henriciella aquimarina]|uniref:CvpA family protein n=1 Tax=Henriciella aquimarina TaxID=545261 RepID=UPI001F42CD97|nr:CvpA family protein [Henriciella aquimarina]
MMDALTAFDAIVIVLLIISTLMALARGFMRELATLGAFIAALAAAYYARLFLRDAVSSIMPGDSPDWLPDLILFLGFFLLVYVIVAWFGANLSKSIQGAEGVSVFDRVAGAAFGFFRGAVVLIFFVFLMRMALDQDRIPEWIRNAQTYPLLEEGAAYVERHAPEVGERVQQQPGLDARTDPA